MTKRIAITITTAVAFLFAGVASQEASASTLSNSGVVHTDGCPSPLVVHPDGTCWP